MSITLHLAIGYVFTISLAAALVTSARGHEQFCTTVPNDREASPRRLCRLHYRSSSNAFLLADEIPFEVGAIMMCSSATAFDALNKARLQSGESVAIFGVGGLGFSALQLARAFGAGAIYVAEITSPNWSRSRLLELCRLMQLPADPVEQIREGTGGKGVDVSIELVGSAVTMSQAVRFVGILARAAIIALTRESMSILPYPELINKEAEVIGAALQAAHCP